MKAPVRTFLLAAGLLLNFLMPGRLAAQAPARRPPVFDAQGSDSASGSPIVIHLVGKQKSAKGWQYAGTCSITAAKGKAKPCGLAGEWRFVQNSNPLLAGGTQPAIAGLGSRVDAKPLRPGESASAPGQLINFTIEPGSNGRYQILLMDAFNDDTLEFEYLSSVAGK